MMNMKKVIATLAAAMILTTGTVSVASAGAIVDFFKSAASTVVNGVKTAGNAVIGAGKYVFTDADGEESFADMKESAKKTGNNFVKMGENVLQAGQDIIDFQMGTVMMCAGGVATAVTAAAEGVTNLVTGNDDYSWTKTTAGVMKMGYDKYDSAFDTAADVASLAGPVGAMAANGIRVVKTAGEAAVGYKDRDWDDVGKAFKDAAVNTVIIAVSGGVGASVSNVVSSTAGTVTAAAAKTVVNTVNDLNNPNNKRSTMDTILENVTTGAITTGTVTAIK